MKGKPVKQHSDLFEQDKEPICVPPGLRKEMFHLVEVQARGWETGSHRGVPCRSSGCTASARSAGSVN